MRSLPTRCPDDLLARNRRGALSDVERRALDAHLAGCALCRTALTFGALCDEIPDQEGPADAEVIARLAARVAEGRARPRRSSRLLAYAAAVALFATAGGAAAWMAVRRETHDVAGLAPRRPTRESPRAPAPAAPEVTGPTTPLDVGAVVAPVIPPDRQVVPPLSRHRVAASRAHGIPVAPIATRATSPAAPESPASLFAAANAARRAGRLRDAVSIYERLENQYPASAEAPVSLVSAADLLLRLGEPASALVKLNRYLGVSHPGPLAPEAMFARARCWHALARPDDERNAWRALTGAFPGSIYEAAARRRLAELAP